MSLEDPNKSIDDISRVVTDESNIEKKESMGGKLLYIYPSAETSPEPTIDELTRKMSASFSHTQEWGPKWRGMHICKCGVFSSNTDYKLTNGMITNSLAVHYLAWHRKEVPTEELDRVRSLEDGEIEPTEDVLKTPKREIPRQ